MEKFTPYLNASLTPFKSESCKVECFDRRSGRVVSGDFESVSCLRSKHSKMTKRRSLKCLTLLLTKIQSGDPDKDPGKGLI